MKNKQTKLKTKEKRNGSRDKKRQKEDLYASKLDRIITSWGCQESF